MKKPRVHSKSVLKVTQGTFTQTPDLLVLEEPLEIRVVYRALETHLPIETSITVTMRTPGNDHELAIGFLYAEGIITSITDIQSIRHCQQTTLENKGNRIKIILQPDITPDLTRLQRNFNSNSSCGVCGKQKIEYITCNTPSLITNTLTITLNTIYSLLKKFSGAQQLFNYTGGIHAAALFHSDGTLITLKEDIGRHNAMDKAIGEGLISTAITLGNSLIMTSSRIGYELIQKTAVAGIPILIAVGAPSNLAVQLADDMGMTLIGFLKNESFNIYTGQWRVRNSTHQPSLKSIIGNSIPNT